MNTPAGVNGKADGKAAVTADVAIVGGGLMGCAAALALRRRGRSVVLLEQGWCGAQASGVNYGGVRRQGRGAAQLPLAGRAHALWATLAETLECDIEYVRTGHLKLAADAAGLAELEAYHALAASHGMPLELLSRAALQRRYPWLGAACAGASLSPEDGQANPRLLAAAYARRARRAGVDVYEHCAVLAIHREAGGFVLDTDGGRVRAAQLANCAGAWGATLAATFGEPVPATVIHPNMLVTEPLPPLMTINVGIVGGSFYARQVARGNVVVGGGRGTGALSLDASRPVGDSTRRALQAACRHVPALAQALVIRSWTGVEGALPDHQPVLGPSATTPGLVHAFGFSGGGFQLAPAVGEVLAELLCDGRSTTPLDAFRADRFAASPGSAPDSLFDSLSGSTLDSTPGSTPDPLSLSPARSLR
ncbi:MAG: NAD(P)/FAD-dependent oxidoreductase [Janthinobacterium lividum]